jgi:hypothetical protein
MIFLGGPDSDPEAEIVTPPPLLIKLAVAAACCCDPPHEVKPGKAAAIKHNFIAPLMDGASSCSSYQGHADAFPLNAFDQNPLIFGGAIS